MLIFSSSISAQWKLLENSPTAGFRHDDIFFIDEHTGWVVNVDGFIYRTTDGGTSWLKQLEKPETSFRSVGFANANLGWAGNLGPSSWSPTVDTHPLYQTTDGGNSWTPVTTIEGPMPTGICGIFAVDEQVVYAVGRVRGPCHILKTTNGGASWKSTPFPIPTSLIDCHFFSADTGIIVGKVGANNDIDERYVVFYTTSGGDVWEVVHTTTTFHSTCWKISFPSRKTGYISLQAWEDMDSIPVLKTTDGGVTWTEKLWNSTHRFQQGIGFMSDSLGWCGHRAGTIRETTDGGESWKDVPFVTNFNRFRKVNDSVGYASGNRIWKYTRNTPSTAEQEKPLPGLRLEQNFPNPFLEKTTIAYTIPRRGLVELRVYDDDGRPVQTVIREIKEQGAHQAELHLPFHYNAAFFYTLSFEGHMLTGKMLMQQ